MINSKHLAALAGALVMAGAAEAQDLASAHRFVADLYARYNRDPGYSPFADRRSEAAVFEPSLLRLIDADERAAGPGEVGALDFDPICDCQDADGLKVTLSAARAAGRGAASVTATESAAFVGKSRGNPITLDLVWTPVGWRVADIHTAATPSLRRFLVQGVKDLKP